MKRISKRRANRYSTQKLVRIALRFWESDITWDAITTMQMRGSPKTLALAQALATSKSWRKRCLGHYVASQLLKRTPSGEQSCIEYAVNETQALLLVGLHDHHEEVVRAAVSGFGHRPHPDALPQLVRLSAHSNSKLRWSVAIALGRYPDTTSISALMVLARDADNTVRDWATFALGSIHKIDSQEIRDLFWTNLHDQDTDVRGEALVGLAERGDSRVGGYLMEHLDGNCRVYELEAAEKMADPRLAPTLLELASVAVDSTTDHYWRGRLSAAIAACSSA